MFILPSAVNGMTSGRPVQAPFRQRSAPSNTSIIGDFSGPNADYFDIENYGSTGELVLIYGLSITISCIAPFATGGFGTLAAPGLANGIELYYTMLRGPDPEGQPVTDMFAEQPIKTTDGWSSFCNQRFSGAARRVWYWDIAKQFGGPVQIDGDSGKALTLVVSDDLTLLTTGLQDHFIIGHGVEVTASPGTARSFPLPSWG